MKKTSISILVPVYNVEKYLTRCIESVLSQDFTDYELILVDDGSSDKSGEICDKYASKDLRIKVIHQKNGGASFARLSGLNKSIGEYIIFLDSDDYLLPHSLTTFYTKIEQGYDIVKCFPLRCDEKGRKWVEKYNVDNGTFHDKNFFVTSLIKDDIAPYLHSAIYKKSLFSNEVFEKQIKNNITIGEDWVINFMISSKVSKVAFIEKPLYVYFVNSQSMMHEKVKSWEYQNRINKTLKDYYENLSDELKLCLAINGFRTDLRYFFIPELKFNHKKYKELTSIYKTHKKEIRKIVEDKYLRFFDIEPLYIIYTMIYRLLYFIVKMKFNKRQIIR